VGEFHGRKCETAARDHAGPATAPWEKKERSGRIIENKKSTNK
jgi:hypothetical protein